jgi:hypothetical protein
VLARRLLILLAVLLGLTALAAGVAPRQSVRDDPGTVPPPPAARAPAEPLEQTLDAQSSGQRIVARVGQTVVITVESTELDSVSLAERGIEPVEPDSPARFELLADTPGDYAIDLLQAERTIGTLEIRPAGG